MARIRPVKRALQRAKQADELGIALVALAGVAELAAAAGEPKRAWHLATLVANHPVSWRETKERAQAVLQALRGSTPEDWQAESGEQAGRWNVWEKVDDLQNEPKW